MTNLQILQILLNAEIAERDDLPCKATTLRAQVIIELAKDLGTAELSADQIYELEAQLNYLP